MWYQAIGLLMGLRIRNGFGNEDLTAAVGAALTKRAGRNCEDCGMKVACGAGLARRGGVPLAGDP